MDDPIGLPPPQKASEGHHKGAMQKRNPPGDEVAIPGIHGALDPNKRVEQLWSTRRHTTLFYLLCEQVLSHGVAQWYIYELE